MKQWWLNLSIREQKIVIIAATVLLIMIAYFFIWSPLSDSVDTLQQNVIQDRDLLSWMKITVPQIGSVNSMGNIAHPVAEADLFGTVQQSLLTSGLKSSLENIEQQKEGTVKLSFHSVSFDNLIDWLLTLQRDYGIIPVEVNLDKDVEGHVKGEIILQTNQK